MVFFFVLVKIWIFLYLIVDDGEEFLGKFVCDNEGFMKKLIDEENIIL